MAARRPADTRPFDGRLLIADRGNNRLLLVDKAKQVLWRYPAPGRPAPRGGFYFPDDAFFVAHGTGILSNEEDNDTIVRVGFPTGRVQWSYGHPRQPGSSPGYLNQPDDAYLLADSRTVVADAKNCRILILSARRRPIGQLGRTGDCVHDPPRSLGYPNGDTPLTNGHLLTSEITGSWITEMTLTGRLVWTTHLPLAYPSDPQQLGPDRYLAVDYHRRGSIVEFNRKGHILWRYRSVRGNAMLDHPSLAERLPNGLIAVNDDYRHRVVLIDPVTRKIVWQYGATDRKGTRDGLLNTPDGFDLLASGNRTPTHSQLDRPRVKVVLVGSGSENGWLRRARASPRWGHHARPGLARRRPLPDARALDRAGARTGRADPLHRTRRAHAQLRGHVFLPPQSVPKPKGGYPGVVITDGSVQAYENLYFWAAEDLAAAGYMVMTYDVQGQGDSDLLPAGCPDPSNAIASCPGVPYQQDYNFYQGAEDSLSFFLATATRPSGGSHNPYFRDLDRSRIAVAGHSLGAAAVSVVGQCDKRVKTIVAWDNLNAIKNCAGVTIPARYRSRRLLHAPALALTNDYVFNTQPMASPPDPHAKDAGYRQLAAAKLDTESVAFRGATHLTYTYIPLVFQASELSERMASYYTLAWLDLQLRHRRSGFTRLVGTKFDRSADVHSIGAGIYDPAKADPKDPYSGNVPYKIAGIPVANAVSFYYESAYGLRDPRSRRVRTCVDIRARCPARAPASPRRS